MMCRNPEHQPRIEFISPCPELWTNHDDEKKLHCWQWVYINIL